MAASRTETAQISERYAKALFALAEEKKALDAVAAELAALAEAAEGLPELKRLIENPTISRKHKAETMQALLTKTKANKLFIEFAATLAHNNRLGLLGQIAARYQALLSAHKGEVVVDIATARPLAEAAKKSLAAAIDKAAGKKAKIHLTTNPALLGGATIKIGSTLLDCSVSGKLQRLEMSLNERIAQGS